MIGVLVSRTVSAEILWEWDMGELPSGWWANEYWDFPDTGALSFVHAQTSGSYSVSELAEMRSDTMTVPAGVDTMVVTVFDTWEWDGWYTTGESNCCIWLRVMVPGGDYYTIEFDSHGWGFKESGQPMNAAVEVPLAAGQQFYLYFYSYAGASYGAMAEMLWTVDHLVITDTGGTSLQRSTWGSIKSVF